MRFIPYMFAACCTLIPACSQPQPPMGAMVPVHPRAVAQRQYLALPGRPAIRVAPADTDEAFDRQVAAYAGGAQTTAQAGADSPVVEAQTPGGYVAGADAPGMQQPVEQAGVVQQPVTPATPAVTTPAGSADYAVQITNGTAGRIYVEAHDAAGHIFPCGPMFGGQSINTPPDPIGPLQGAITVVIRDPDKDGAPEIRRYQVQPPPNYKGKTIGITILPGGQYRADLDKEVYYTSPAPSTQAAPGS